MAQLTELAKRMARESNPNTWADEFAKYLAEHPEQDALNHSFLAGWFGMALAAGRSSS